MEKIYEFLPIIFKYCWQFLHHIRVGTAFLQSSRKCLKFINSERLNEPILLILNFESENWHFSLQTSRFSLERGIFPYFTRWSNLSIAFFFSFYQNNVIFPTKMVYYKHLVSFPLRKTSLFLLLKMASFFHQ